MFISAWYNVHMTDHAYAYALPVDADLPDLTLLDGVATTDAGRPGTEATTDADTEDGTLARSGVRLRRTVGGDPDEDGWLLAVGDVRVLRAPGRSATTVPAAMQKLLLAWTGGATVRPTRQTSARTTVTTMSDAAGDPLATVLDCLATGSVDGEESTQRTVTVSGAKGKLAKKIGAALVAAGGEPLERAEEELTEPAGPEVNRNSPARSLLQAQLVALLNAERVGELQTRLGADDAIHQLRITVRRLRALLAVWSPLLDTEIAEPIRARLHTYGAVLGAARDAEVYQERLLAPAQGEPTGTRVGPVVARVRRTLAAERKAADAAVLQRLDSAAHAALLADLAALVEEPPLAEQPGPRVGKVVPALLRRADKRVSQRATKLADPEADHDQTLHAVRKAARRARYTAEAFADQGGPAAQAYAQRMQSLQDVLGERQDALGTQRRLLALAGEATAAGENAFTYGRLHADQQAHLDAADAAYPSLLRKALGASPVKH